MIGARGDGYLMIVAILRLGVVPRHSMITLAPRLWGRGGHAPAVIVTGS
jgi:hypothetical protein